MIIPRIKSVIDGRAMDGVTSFRIHSGPDMTQVRTKAFLSILISLSSSVQERCLIRWTEVFLISTQPPGTSLGNHIRHPTRYFHRSQCAGEPPDPARASEVVARAVCQALQPGLVSLKQETGGSPLAVRVSTGPDNVSTQIILHRPQTTLHRP